MSRVNTIRRAEIGDLQAISRLHARAQTDGGGDISHLSSLFNDGVFLVLDGSGGALAASLYVSIDGACGEASHIAVAPERETVALRERLLSVAEAMCVAQGCEQFNAEWPPDAYLAAAEATLQSA